MGTGSPGACTGAPPSGPWTAAMASSRIPWGQGRRCQGGGGVIPMGGQRAEDW